MAGSWVCCEAQTGMCVKCFVNVNTWEYNLHMPLLVVAAD